MIIPRKLKAGDHIRIVSPSRTLPVIGDKNRQLCLQRLENMGFKVSFSKHIEEYDCMMSTSIEHKLEDLHQAFADPGVDALMSVIGGFNSNALLPYLNYDLIQKNPKILVGYSDVTAIASAINMKTGLITYSGLMFFNFSMQKGFEYQEEYFRKCLMNDEPFEIKPAEFWSDDPWYDEQINRNFIKNEGPVIFHEGEASGVTVGANLCTFNLLQGTEWMPEIRDTILFIEDDYESDAKWFDRNLTSLLQQPGANQIKAVLIGRFQNGSNVTEEQLRYIIETKELLKNIPVIANLDFGHAKPTFTFPHGGTAEISAINGEFSLKIIKH